MKVIHRLRINMAKYFNYFPKTYYYPSYESTSADVVTNIISRFGFEQSFKENSITYYEYSIQDGDTPEIIASKIYNSPERHWIVLAMNDIVDPQYDWPLNQQTLINFIDSKYTSNANTTAGQSGLEWAQANTKKYLKIQTRTDNASGLAVVDKIEIDANTYANVVNSTETYTLQNGYTVKLDTSKETKTYFQYEVEKNDSKRTIKILKDEFVESVESEFKRIMAQ